MPHPLEHSAASRPLSEQEAADLGDAMAMFATASRLRILYALLDGERSVEELAEATGRTPNTVSQQLRLLRSARFVRVHRAGRRAIYSLHDTHVADLLEAVRHHAEHAARGWADTDLRQTETESSR
jgi:DNA-binding transcriptional ArsR family regulator